MSRSMTRRTVLRGAAVGVAAAVVTRLGQPPAHAAALPATIGSLSFDEDPRIGSLASFGSTTGFALDYASRSIGADLGAGWASVAGASPSTGRLSIRLRITTPSHRLNERDFSVHTSNDNLTWTKISGVDYTDIGTSVFFYNFFTADRYLKVHCHREHDSSISVFRHTNLQSMMTVSWSGPNSLIGSDGDWSHKVPVTIENTGTTTLLDTPVSLSRDILGLGGLVSSGLLRSDLGDLRFTSADGRQLRTFVDDAAVHVRIPEIGPSSQQTIQMCVGRPDAESTVADQGALQIVHGKRTFQRHAVTSSAGHTFASQAHPLVLPNGHVALIAGTGAGGLHARYSTNGGRTWTSPVPFLPPTAPGVRKDYPGGFLVNPATGTLIAIIYSLGATGAGNDWTNPAHYDSQIWCARATSFDSSGHPVFAPASRVTLANPVLPGSISYALTYSTPLPTASGAVLAPVSYMYTPRGAMLVDVLRSTDDGQTWTQSATPLRHPGAHLNTDGLSEGSITQLADGRIHFLGRNQVWGEYSFAEAFSSDEGVTWTPAVASSVLASNTVATLVRDKPDESLLIWSGHNAFGQNSFYRNNLSLAAYSTPGQLTGYHDLTAATMYSNPGWESASARIGMIEPMATVSTPTDLLIAWANNGARAGTLLVEDYRDYLERSHGALDVFRHVDTFSGGRELSHSGWLRNSPTGALTLATDVGRPRKVMRIVGGNGPVGASRLFPAVRFGSFRMKLKRLTTAAIDIVVQEAFSHEYMLGIFGANARGTAAALRIDPDGSLTASSTRQFGVTTVAGFTELDTAPATTSIAIGSLLYSTSPIALDYRSRSFGVDLGASREITGLVITGDPAVTGSSTTRVEPSDISLWTSADNATWTPLTGWSGSKSGLQLTFTGPPVTTRYVKASHPYSDSAYSLANLIQDLITVTPDRPDLRHPSIYESVDAPSTIPINTWATLQLDVDVRSETLKVHLDDVLVHTAVTKHTADVLTHVAIAGPATTDLLVDEFMVRDLDRGAPQLVSVGGTQPWIMRRRPPARMNVDGDR